MPTETMYRTLVPQAGGDVARHEPRNFFINVGALVASKTADRLVDPKLVLAWLMTALGAPAYLIGLLVPIRESLALLPQLLLAPRVQAARRKKLFWAAGSLVQGLAATGMGVAALLVGGTAAGWIIVGLLVVLSTARSVCSVSHKDALARTVAKGTRGTVSGTAGTVGSAAGLLFGLLLAFDIVPLSVASIAGALLVAGGLWLCGAAIFAALKEAPLEPEAAEAMGFRVLVEPLKTDPQLRRFIAARGLLTATALAPPFIVTLSAADQASRIGELGPLVLASGAASILSSYVWGRLSDRSSRQTLMAAGALGAAVLGVAAALGWATGGVGGTLGAAAVIFFAQIGYQGVRTGRKTHLTDMATDRNRARYTALSNTAIGLILLVTGAFGLLAESFGVPFVLALFALMALAGAGAAATMAEVQNPEPRG